MKYQLKAGAKVQVRRAVSAESFRPHEMREAIELGELYLTVEFMGWQIRFQAKDLEAGYYRPGPRGPIRPMGS